MIKLNNTEVAFKSKSDKDLKRAHWLFKLISNDRMVKLGKWATKVAMKTYLPIEGLIRKTIFKQFCGGTSIEDSLETTKRLADQNVKSILDYSIEGKTSDEDFDYTVGEIIRTMEEAKRNPNIPYAVFKTTGLCPISILEKANQTIDDLNEEERAIYNKLEERVDKICHAAYESGIPLFIDAEETWIQNTIDRMVYKMAVKYNKERAVVFNTIQMYRHDRLAYMQEQIDLARKEGWFLGLKIVRGAYMEKERERAALKGYPDPIQPNKEATDRDYNESLRIAVENRDVISICAGTHNEKSTEVLMELLEQHQIDKNDKRFYFSQLLGMSDHISFNLGAAGYMVAKYVPYGPIKEVLPYLIRRAEENTSIAGQTSRELLLINQELERRKKK